MRELQPKAYQLGKLADRNRTSKKKQEVQKSGRECCHGQCRTILSIYNEDPWCWEHQPRVEGSFHGGPR